MRRCRIFTALAALGWAGPAAAGVAVFVSIPPQKYFVERIGGDSVEVGVLLGPGQSPHTFEPTPKQIARLTSAAVYFRSGMPFEDSFLDKLRSANPTLELVDAREGIELLPMTGHADHDEGGHAHEEGRPDPHWWLDPKRAKVQAEVIAATLARLDPSGGPGYRRNLAALEVDIDRVADRIRQLLAPLKGREFFVYHPAYGYFGEAFGLRQEAVEIGGKEPSARQLAGLIERAREARVQVIFVQPQFSRKSAQTIARAIKGAVIPLDPLAEDYLANLEEMATHLAEALAPRP